MNHYVSIPLTERHYELASQTVLTETCLKGNVIGKTANLIGRLGEIVVIDYLNQQEVQFTEDFTVYQDLTIVGSGPLEVKTKNRTTAPKPYYDASIPTYSHKFQNVSYWVFVSLERNKDYSGDFIRGYHQAHIVGVANRSITQTGTVVHAGDYDESNDLTLRMTTINIPLRNLKPIEEATAIWKSRQTERHSS